MSDDDEPRQILMHEALLPAFDAWLASRGLECRRIGKATGDEMDWWIITPTDATLGVATREGDPPPTSR